jgi:hypothetical protein
MTEQNTGKYWQRQSVGSIQARSATFKTLQTYIKICCVALVLAQTMPDSQI